MIGQVFYWLILFFKFFFDHDKTLVNSFLTLFNTIIFVDILNLRFSSYIFDTKVIV